MSAYRTLFVQFFTAIPESQLKYTINYAALQPPVGQQWFTEAPYTEPKANESFTSNGNWGSSSTAVNTGTQATIMLSSTLGNMQLSWKFPWSGQYSAGISWDRSEYAKKENIIVAQDNKEWIDGQTILWQLTIGKGSSPAQFRKAIDDAVAQAAQLAKHRAHK